MQRVRLHGSQGVNAATVTVALGLLAVLVGAASLRAQTVLGQTVEGEVGTHAAGSATADFNQDGHADVALSATEGIMIRFGDGAGGLGPPVLTTPPVGSQLMAFADLDGDGLVERLASPTGVVPQQLWVCRGLGGAAFGAVESYPVAGQSAFAGGAVTVRDLDGDDDEDVCVAIGSELVANSAMNLYLNDGTGTLTHQVLLPDVPLVAGSAADFDADGRPDLVYSTASSPFVQTTYVLQGQPGGGFVELIVWPQTFLFDVSDLDDDGRLDVLLRGIVPNLEARMNLGDAKFAVGPGTNVDGVITALGKFTDDDVPDLLLLEGDSSINQSFTVWPGDGLGGFDSTQAARANRTDLEVLGVLADVVTDGRLDIVATRTVPPFSTSLQVTVVPNLTYPSDAPVLDLAHSLYGGGGWPGQLMLGSFIAHEEVTIDVWAAGPGLPALLVVGLSEIGAAFKGGTMVPNPDLLVGPLTTAADGTLEVKGRWPRGLPPGTPVTFQWWIADAQAPAGMAATSAARVTTP
jgi:hypothetical protein